MDRTQITVGMLLVGLSGLAVATLGLWLRRRLTTSAPRAAEPVFGSDAPPPAGTVEFNVAIVNACGPRTSDEFILTMLCRADITIARALTLSRQEIESQLPDPSAPEARK